jgi:transposase-like protein
MTTRLRNKLASHKEQVREAYRNGATMREIADLHSVSTGTVRNCLIELGEATRPRGRRKKADSEEVSRLLPLDGVSVETAETVGAPLN